MQRRRRSEVRAAGSTWFWLDEPSSALSTASRKERLEYIASMTFELRALADESTCATLAGLLALAHEEARLQAAR